MHKARKKGILLVCDLEDMGELGRRGIFTYGVPITEVGMGCHWYPLISWESSSLDLSLRKKE